MRIKTSAVAEAVRLQQWSEQISACQNRPADMKMDDWCSQQGISKANYYYRLRRVRQAVLDCSSEKKTIDRVPSKTRSFVELPVPLNPQKIQPAAGLQKVMSGNTAAIIRGSKGISIEIFSNTSPEMLHALMRALSHAECWKRLHQNLPGKCGYTDLRRGIEGLAGIIRFQFELDPYD